MFGWNKAVRNREVYFKKGGLGIWSISFIQLKFIRINFVDYSFEIRIVYFKKIVLISRGWVKCPNNNVGLIIIRKRSHEITIIAKYK